MSGDSPRSWLVTLEFKYEQLHSMNQHNFKPILPRPTEPYWLPDPLFAAVYFVSHFFFFFLTV